MPQGKDFNELGYLGEQSFCELLNAWAGIKLTDITRHASDIYGIDWIVPFSAIDDLNILLVNWQVKVRDIQSVQSHMYQGEACFRLDLKKSEIESIYKGLRGHPFFIVLGIPQANLAEMSSMKPVERFTWYALDIRQYLRRFYPGKSFRETNLKSISIPIRNRLTLPMFSLLWASLNVQFFTDVFHSSVSHLDRYNVISQSSWLIGIDENGINKLINDFAIIQEERKVEELLNFDYVARTLLSVLRTNNALQEKSFTNYVTYTTESLGSEISLWLFFRPFIEYALKWNNSRVVQNALRLFPVADLEKQSLSLRTILYYVLLWHRKNDITCKLTKPGVKDRHDILAVFGDHIVRIEHKKSDINRIILEKNKKSKSIHEELKELESHSIVSSRSIDLEILSTLALNEYGFELNNVQRPIDLLASENSLITHPAFVFNIQ